MGNGTISTKLLAVYYFFVVAMVFVGIPTHAKADECAASLDSQANTLHVPCFSLNNQSLQLYFSLISIDSIQLQLINFEGSGPSSHECTASLDTQSNTFHVPCFSLNNQSLWLDFRLISFDPVQIQLINSGENARTPYYEVYGAQAGDYGLMTEGHQLVGTSNSGTNFNVSAYGRFIIYVPPSSSTILFDAFGLDAGWVESAPGSEYANQSSNMMLTGSTWEQGDNYIEGPPNGLTMENTPGNDLGSYYGFSTLGASALTVYLFNQ